MAADATGADGHGRAPRFDQRQRVLLEWLLVAALSTAIVALLGAQALTARLDNLIYDAVAKLTVRPPDPRIVIVAIDNRSIAAIGRWPWPRTQHQALLDRLHDARPRAIGYDVLFTEPDPDPARDQALGAAVAAAGPVFLPLSFDVPGDDGAPFRLVPPVAPLRAAAAGVGQVNLEFDPDGVVRRAHLVAAGDGQAWPHLVELMYRAQQRHPSEAYVDARRRMSATADDAGLHRSPPLMIAYAGRPGHFRTVSFVDVLRGEVPPQFLQDKLVLVGSTADGLGDRYATPLSDGSEIMSGVELQANLLDTLLTGREVRPLGRGAIAALSLIPLWIMLAGFLRLRPRANMVLGLALTAAPLVAAALLLSLGRIWAPPTAAIAGVLVVYPLWSWRRLEASSAYMLAELRRFAAEPDLLPAAAAAGGGPPGDVVARQMDLMQAALRRVRDLRRFLADIVRGLPDATVVADLDERVIVANREADALFRALGGGPASGRTLGELSAALVPNHGEPSPSPDGDVEMTAPDGRAFNVRRIALTGAGDEALGWIVRYTDISALKAAGRQRDDILQLLTHDMRSPQVSILALLDGPAAAGLEPTIVGRIGGYARRTLSLADNFVNLARAETDQFTLETVNLRDVLLDAVDDLWPQSSAKQIAVATPDTDEEYLVDADRSLLTRALINLVDNAIKYTDAGGRVDCSLRVARDGPAPQVVCAIADTGRGMSREETEHLFERFRRAPTGGLAHIGGVGLGLAFVQTVVQRHGGAITCESRPGVGTTFQITLPLAGGRH